MESLSIEIIKFLIELLVVLPGVIIGLVLHEFAHALAADRLGDPTPRRLGRLTINPLPHIDIFGFIALMVVKIGWAKPVPVNPANLKSPKRDMAMIAAVGPLTNLVLVVLFGLTLAVLSRFGAVNNISGTIVYILIDVILHNAMYINSALFVLNLIPMPPFDGSRVLSAFFGDGMAKRYMMLQRYWIIFLIILLLPNVSETLIGKPAQAIMSVTLRILGVV